MFIWDFHQSLPNAEGRGLFGTMGFFFSDFEVTSKKALNNHRTSEQTSTTGSQRREDQKSLLITVVGFFEWDNEL